MPNTHEDRPSWQNFLTPAAAGLLLVHMPLPSCGGAGTCHGYGVGIFTPDGRRRRIRDTLRLTPHGAAYLAM